jgi:hypothetical protein
VKKYQQLAQLHQLRTFQKMKKKILSQVKILTLTTVLDHLYIDLNLVYLLPRHRVSKIEQNIHVLRTHAVRQHHQFVTDCSTKLFLTLLGLHHFSSSQLIACLLDTLVVRGKPSVPQLVPGIKAKRRNL